MFLTVSRKVTEFEDYSDLIQKLRLLLWLLHAWNETLVIISPHHIIEFCEISFKMLHMSLNILGLRITFFYSAAVAG